jgi:virginiamycin A acetyltransferase
MHGPSPSDPHPMAGFPQVCFIKNTVKNPAIVIGDFTYYDDPENAEDFERNVLNHFPFLGDRLVIGKFCAIAHGVRFIMIGANHKLTGLSTYPFCIFGQGWEAAMPKPDELPFKGDAIVGNDVWLGYEAVIMPAVRIADGAIVAAKSVVTRDVPAYAVVGGNPAGLIRKRFDDDTIADLQALAWWDWPVGKIAAAIPAIIGADIEALKRCR